MRVESTPLPCGGPGPCGPVPAATRGPAGGERDQDGRVRRDDRPVLSVRGLVRRFGSLRGVGRHRSRRPRGGARGAARPERQRQDDAAALHRGLGRADLGSRSRSAGHPAGSLEARRLTGVSLSQERSFYLRLSGRENLLLFARLHGLRKAAAARAGARARRRARARRHPRPARRPLLDRAAAAARVRARAARRPGAPARRADALARRGGAGDASGRRSRGVRRRAPSSRPTSTRTSPSALASSRSGARDDGHDSSRASRLPAAALVPARLRGRPRVRRGRPPSLLLHLAGRGGRSRSRPRRGAHVLRLRGRRDSDVARRHLGHDRHRESHP